MGLYSDVNSVLLIYLDSGFGLTKDARILEFELTRLGKTVSHLKVGKQSKRRWGPIGHKTRSLPKPEKPHDLAIHIDIVSKYLLNQADRHTHMPNLEFFKVKFEWFYGCFDSVLAKTHETVDVLAKIKRGDFVGFRSEDHGMPGIAKDWDRFLHVAGGSRLKGTKWLLELWRRHPEWPELVVKHANRHDFGDFPQNVKEITGHMSDQELKELQNSFGIHLCPSEAEGYGQYLVEALSQARSR